MLALLAAAVLAQPTAAETDWIKSHAIPIATPEAGHGFDDLQALKAIIANARIVSLGEPTHGTREAFQFKHRLLEFLASEMGFTIFSIEASMPESYRLNDYVLRGEGDPRAGIKGMYFWTWDTEEVLAMVEWMRAFNASGRGPLQFTGFDMQFEQVAMANALAFAERADPDFVPRLKTAFDAISRASATPSQGGAGIVTGMFPVALARGKKVTFSGAIRSDSLAGFAGLWWRVDGEKGTLAFDNMSDRGPHGTTPWTRYEITLDVPPDATNINFGLLSVASAGTAWFDSLAITLDNVSFSDPESFDLGFEKGNAGLRCMTPAFTCDVVADRPDSGKRCLRLAAPDKPADDQVPPERARTLADEVLSHLEANAARYAGTLPAPDVAWGIQNARVVAQCARMKAGMAAQDPREEWSRDFAMAQNVKWILDQNPGARIVLWAHNGHVGRSRWAMGRFVERLMPGQQVVVGFTTSHGEYTAITPGKGLAVNPLQPPPPASVEAYLDSAGVTDFLLDIRQAKSDPASFWLTHPHAFRLIGALAMDEQFFPRTMSEEFDVLVHQRDTTAARSLWQVVPRPN